MEKDLERKLEKMGQEDLLRLRVYMDALAREQAMGCPCSTDQCTAAQAVDVQEIADHNPG